MKTLPIIYLLLLATNSFAQNNQDHFKSEIDFGNGTVFSTFLDLTVDQNQFTITSPKNADVRIMGWKARLGRILGKSPKKGIIVTIKGRQNSDSLFGETTIPMVGKLKFKGSVKNEVLSGVFTSNDTTAIGTLHGVKSNEKRIEYHQLYPAVLKTIQDNIYSRDLLQTREWKSFEKKTESLFNEAHDDIELFLGFNILAQKLPFSHISLSVSEDVADSGETASPQKFVIFEEKNDNTAYLLIKNFSSSTDELAAILPQIVANQHYKNLIIDLRNNPGGGIEAAFEFAKYIMLKNTEVGYFITNKLQYSGYQPELFNKLPALQPKSTTAFTNDLKTRSGAKLVFKKPDNPVFTGNLYVLTNGKTASTCEPIVYVLKNSKRALVIGEKTAGAMLAACPFDIGGKYSIVLPIADFYTYDGVRLDQVGVSPDIATTAEEALEKAMELINNNKNN